MKPETVTSRVSMSGMFDGTAYSVAGEGDALVLIHGVGMNRGVWAPQVDALQDSFRVVSYDMLGHGASRLPTAFAPRLNFFANASLTMATFGAVRPSARVKSRPARSGTPSVEK